MYNPEIKEKFIKWYQSKKSWDVTSLCISVFNTCEPFEVVWRADLCTKDKDDLAPMIDEVAGLRSKSAWSRLIVLKDYCRWCIATGVFGACEGMFSIDSVGLKKVRTRMVSNPMHLKRYLDSIFEDDSMETVDCIYRCCFWLMYMGYDEDVLTEINTSDVDLSNATVNVAGNQVRMYQESMESFYNAVTLRSFRFVHPNYSDKVIYRDRAPGNRLIRGIRGAPTKNAIRSELAKRSRIAYDEGKTDIKLSMQRAKLSGIFFRKYELELAGYGVDFTDIAEDFIGDKVYKLDSGRNTQEYKHKKIASEYLEDYQRWKAAFI